jgi:hypothetical protein
MDRNITLKVESFDLELWTVDDILHFFNHFWIVQIFVSLVYCFFTRRYLPHLNSSGNTSIFIRQFFIYLLANSSIYVVEIFSTNVVFSKLERFLHHIFAMLIFWTQLTDPGLVCLVTLIPYFIHSVYWLFLTGPYWSDFILVVYNVSMAVSVCVLIKYIHVIEMCKKLRQLIWLTAFLAHINMFSFFYDYNLNLYSVDARKCANSLLASTLICLPLYFVLIRLNYSRKRFSSPYSIVNEMEV